jgi:hypothetical protein
LKIARKRKNRAHYKVKFHLQLSHTYHIFKNYQQYYYVSHLEEIF